MARVNIVMAAYNNWERTKVTLDSVIKNSHTDYKMIAVNNGSTDETSDNILEYLNYDQITYIKNKKNEGCGIGRNSGLREIDSDCEYIILIDNDIYATPNWDSKLVEFMDECSEVAIAGPRTNFAGTPQLISNCPKFSSFEDIEAYSDFDRKTPRYSKVPFKWTVIGFCMIIRRRSFEKIGLFDENFKLYGCEDNDYCYRAQRMGMTLAYIQDIYVHHFGHGGLSQLGEEGIVQWEKNRKYFETKNDFI